MHPQALSRQTLAARSRLLAVLGAAMLAVVAPASALTALQATAGPDSEPFPITVDAQPSTTLTGTPVTLSGSTLALLNSDVIVTISAPRSSPPQSAKLTAIRSADGTFKVSYIPKVEGTYTVDAIAPDGAGRASTTFLVENARQPSAATTGAVADLTKDASEIVSISRSNLNNVPPSPARDDAEQKLDSLTQTLGQLVELSQDFSQSLGKVIPLSATLPPPSQITDPPPSGPGTTAAGGNYSMGGHYDPTLAKAGEERQALIEGLGQVAQAHERSQQEIQKLKKEELTCDNLEKVGEGIKLVGGMLNLVAGPVGIAKNFAVDFAASAVSDQVSKRTGSGFGSFAASEVYKNIDVVHDFEKRSTRLKLNLGNAVSFTNDIASALVGIVMSAYCEQFTGPVTAHMHATFTDQGMKWWEYSFDVHAQIFLHYPKGASGGSVPLKGRIEGFANNYKVWDNALTVKYPGLMVSTVQKHIYVLPLALADSQTGFFQKVSSVEGSILGQAVTPSSFMFSVTGTATADKLDIQVGTPGHDTDAKARAIVLYAAVLSLSMGYEVYTLPYKPVHFVFERAAGSYSIDLTTKNKVVRGKQHFENQKTNGGAMGEYSVDIEACNPDC
jgi:hypothetical protein